MLGSVIGMFGLAALSYWKLGLSATLSWFAPTAAIFLLNGVLEHFKTKDKHQNSGEKTPTQEKNNSFSIAFNLCNYTNFLGMPSKVRQPIFTPTSRTGT